MSNPSMFGLGTTELLILMLVMVLLFGSARIPQLARSMGKSITEFKKGMRDVEKEIEHTSES